METFTLKASRALFEELEQIFHYYDFKYDLIPSDEGETAVIQRIMKDGTTRECDGIEDFILRGIFYKRKKNFYHFPLVNANEKVANFDLDPWDFFSNNPVLKTLLENPLLCNYITQVYNSGIFFRFSENKVQRLYWNPPFNAGLPPTAKERDSMYELIFFLHDWGHFYLRDLVFTGIVDDLLAEIIYVFWRLLGESITIVLNEMIVVDYLKDTFEFKSRLKLGFDKPYSLYQHLDKKDLKKVFWASALYFVLQNSSGFEALLDLDDKQAKTAWEEFDTRYYPVSKRGREWTTTNFTRMKEMGTDFQAWWNVIEKTRDLVPMETIEQYYTEFCSSSTGTCDFDVLKLLFERVWNSLLRPLFTREVPVEQSLNERISNSQRKIKAFQRFMLGNIFILVKNQRNYESLLQMVMNLQDDDHLDSNMKLIEENYQAQILECYQAGEITCNEYHNYKSMYIMIPPNILKK